MSTFLTRKAAKISENKEEIIKEDEHYLILCYDYNMLLS